MCVPQIQEEEARVAKRQAKDANAAAAAAAAAEAEYERVNGASRQDAAGWGKSPKVATPSRGLAEVMAEEAVEANRREAVSQQRAASQIAETVAARAAGQQVRSTCWGSNPSSVAGSAPPPAPAAAPRQAAAASRPLESESLLFDYSASTDVAPSAQAWLQMAQRAAAAPSQPAPAPACKAATDNGGAAKGGALKQQQPAASAPGPAQPAAETSLGVAELPAELTAWCCKALPPLTGNSDVSLAEFLYSLTADSEVEEFVKLYLGDGKEARAFVKEFLERAKAARFKPVQAKAKAAVPGKGDEGGEDEGGSALQAGGKKGKKKGKPVDMRLLGFAVESSRIMKGEIDLGE
ncbi:hypothetical protein T492DRAFT_87783 [Pavlovales sp. CCMP2436]|nr:hypothetical protein T492DRAFT_87783 [Pavlovales sp. CCMP2436]